MSNSFATRSIWLFRVLFKAIAHENGWHMHFRAQNTLTFKINKNEQLSWKITNPTAHHRLRYGVRSELYLTLKLGRGVRELPSTDLLDQKGLEGEKCICLRDPVNSAHAMNLPLSRLNLPGGQQPASWLRNYPAMDIYVLFAYRHLTYIWSHYYWVNTPRYISQHSLSNNISTKMYYKYKTKQYLLWCFDKVQWLITLCLRFLSKHYGWQYIQ